MTESSAYFFREPNVSPWQLYVYQCVAKLLQLRRTGWMDPAAMSYLHRAKIRSGFFDASVNNGVGIVRSGLLSLIIQQPCIARVNG